MANVPSKFKYCPSNFEENKNYINVKIEKLQNVFLSSFFKYRGCSPADFEVGVLRFYATRPHNFLGCKAQRSSVV